MLKSITQVIAWLCIAVPCTWASTAIDPTNKHAWTENAGWINAAPTNGRVSVHFNGVSGYLTGHAWGENIGWIKLGADSGGPYSNNRSTNWGVNFDSAGNLTGYAWGENVGWINFEQTLGAPSINLTNGEFSGHVWGENIGWLTFRGTSPDYGVRTLAFDVQAQGTPNWWLDYHEVTEDYDVGDGVPAFLKYVMDTNPRTAGDYLRITDVSNAPAGADVAFAPASTRRYYTLVRREGMETGGWSNVATQVGIQGTGGSQAMQDTNAAARMFYSVKVTVTP